MLLWRRARTSLTFSDTDLDELKVFFDKTLILSSRQTDGKSLREHLENIWKQTGQKPVELEDTPELPSQFIYCYEVFRDLSSRRPSGFGASPISYSEIYAYKNLLDIDLAIWEVRVIIILDEWLLDHIAKEEEKKSKK